MLTRDRTWSIADGEIAALKVIRWPQTAGQASTIKPLPGRCCPVRSACCLGCRVRQQDPEDREFKRTFFSQSPPGKAPEHPLMRSLGSAAAC